MEEGITKNPRIFTNKIYMLEILIAERRVHRFKREMSSIGLNDSIPMHFFTSEYISATQTVKALKVFT